MESIHKKINTCCVSIQGLHLSKDPVFVVFEGESCGETLLTASTVWDGRAFWSISWLHHHMFYFYVMISATQARESDDLRHATLSFSGTQRILGHEATKDRNSASSKKREKKERLLAAFGGDFESGQPSRSPVTELAFKRSSEGCSP